MCKDNRVEIDIWGSCVSRDVFSFYSPDFRINNFFQECSPVVAFSDGKLPEVTISEFIETCNRTLSWAKWFSADINKTVLKTLSDSASEWIVVDLRCFTYDITKYDFGNGIVGYTTGKHKERFEVLKRKGLNFNSKNVDVRTINLKKYITDLAVFLKERYGEKIILIDMREAFDIINEDGSLSFCNPSLDAFYIEETVGLDFIKQTDCYYIKTPSNIVADCHHIWGGTPAHYTSEYYEYAYDAILEIVQNHGKKSKSDIQLKLDMMFMEITGVFSNIRRGKKLPIRNTLKRVEIQLSNGETSKALETIGLLVKEGIPEAYGHFARMYRDGRGLNTDLVIAAEWMRKAVDGNVWWAITELLDILRKINTQDSLDEMLTIAKTYSEIGNSNAMLRLGWAYRDGKGVEQDYEKAAEWMRKSASYGLGRAKNDLFDLLWKIDTPESHKEMISVAKEHASNGDGSAMLRLGRAYRDGKGVEQDYEKAAEWMRKSVERNVTWANNELFDVLRIIDTPESRKEMIFISTNTKEKHYGTELKLDDIYQNEEGIEQDCKKTIGLKNNVSEKKPCEGGDKGTFDKMRHLLSSLKLK